MSAEICQLNTGDLRGSTGDLPFPGDARRSKRRHRVCLGDDDDCDVDDDDDDDMMMVMMMTMLMVMMMVSR